MPMRGEADLTSGRENGRLPLFYQKKSLLVGGLLVGFFLMFPASLAGAYSGQAKGIYADFNVLKKAQKDIQKDLGLPDSSGGAEKGFAATEADAMQNHPVIITLLLFGLGIGIVLLGWVIRHEQKKEELVPEEKQTSHLFFSGERNDLPDPVLERIPVAREVKKPKLESLLSQRAHSSGDFLSYLEKLDLFLEVLRKSSIVPESSSVSLYALRSNAAFHSLLSRSSGNGFPRFYRPTLLTEPRQALLDRFSEFGGGNLSGEGGSIILQDGKINLLVFLFFDAKGIAYLILFSTFSVNDHGRWFRAIAADPSEMLLTLRKYLNDYSRFDFQLPEDTVDGYGILDGRGFENRLFQEMERSERLHTQMLLLILYTKDERKQGISSGRGQDEEFLDRLQRGVALGVRSGDSLTRPGDGVLFLLLPETLEADSPVIKDRLFRIFESTKTDMHRKELSLEVREGAFSGGDKELLFQFLSSN